MLSTKFGNLRRSCARRLAERQRAANLATIRAAAIAALKDDGYLHIPEGRHDHTTPAETLRLHGLDQDTSGHSPNTPEP